LLNHFLPPHSNIIIYIPFKLRDHILSNSKKKGEHNTTQHYSIKLKQQPIETFIDIYRHIYRHKRVMSPILSRIIQTRLKGSLNHTYIDTFIYKRVMSPMLSRIIQTRLKGYLNHTYIDIFRQKSDVPNTLSDNSDEIKRVLESHLYRHI
jgi:hypothetical protein